MANNHPNDHSQKPGSENFGTSNAMRIRTLILVAAFLIFGFGLLVYQLYVLQIRDYETYRVDATEQPDAAEWNSMQNIMQQIATGQRAQAIFSIFMRDLFKNADIKVLNPDVVTRKAG